MASAQVCGGVQKNTMRNITNGVSARLPVTAVQPISGGKQPAMPPQMMFCGVRRFSQSV